MLEFLVSDGPHRGATFPFPSSRFIVGSAPGCPLRLTQAAVAPQHVEIVTDAAGQVRVVDLTGQKVEVNGLAVAEARLLPGSFLMLGAVQLLVREIDPRGPETAATLVAAQRDVSSGPTELLPGVAATVAGLEALRTREEAPRPEEERSSPDPVQVGAVIDHRYRIVKRLAVGGMGEVYRAEHVELHKPMALKVMLKELSKDEEFVSRFRREAVAVSKLGHENIVDISDFGQTADGRLYFVMEYLEGMTLSRHLRKVGPLPVERACVVGAQIARALAAAHAHSIVHRDLKPDNLMLVQRAGNAELVKVLDFGVAKITQGTLVGQTMAGVVMGTPQYMSPEQARGYLVDARSDLYALGLILHEALTGKPTFEAESPPAVMLKQATAPPPPLPKGLVPPPLSDLVMRLLAKKAEDRPERAELVVKELERITAELQVAAATPRASAPHSGDWPAEGPPPPEEPSPAAPRPRRRAPLLIGAAALAALGVLGGAWALLPPRTDSEPPRPSAGPPPAEAPRPPAAAAPNTAQLALKSEPERAEVYEGELLLGTTPMALKRPLGAVVELRFALKGYKPEARKLGFAGDSEITVTLEKERTRAPGPRRPPGQELRDLPDY